jgi:hypothetical protein
MQILNGKLFIVFHIVNLSFSYCQNTIYNMFIYPIKCPLMATTYNTHYKFTTLTMGDIPQKMAKIDTQKKGQHKIINIHVVYQNMPFSSTGRLGYLCRYIQSCYFLLLYFSGPGCLNELGSCIT